MKRFIRVAITAASVSIVGSAFAQATPAAEPNAEQTARQRTTEPAAPQTAEERAQQLADRAEQDRAAAAQERDRAAEAVRQEEAELVQQAERARVRQAEVDAQAARARQQQGELQQETARTRAQQAELEEQNARTRAQQEDLEVQSERVRREQGQLEQEAERARAQSAQLGEEAQRARAQQAALEEQAALQDEQARAIAAEREAQRAAARVIADETRAKAVDARKRAEEAQKVADAAQAEADTATAAAVAAALVAERLDDLGPKRYEGRWVGALGISGSLNLSSQSNVPGAPQGISANVSVSADGVLDYLKGKNEWRNAMTLGVGITRSASDEIWVKTSDTLRIQSAYYYALAKWFGPFAEFEFRTSMFPLTIRRPSNDTYFCIDGTSLADCATGTSAGQIDQSRKLSATGAFQPIALNERFGLFLRPVDRTYFRLAVRAGFGAQQYYIKSGSYMELNRNAAGDAVIVQELNRYGIFGAMVDLQIRGAAKSEGFLYGANAALLHPFVDTRSDQLDARGIKSPTQIDLGAFMTLKISDWASVDVRAAAARVPQVTGDKWQTSIMTLLTFSYAVVGDLDSARDSATTMRNADFQGATGTLEVKD